MRAVKKILAVAAVAVSFLAATPSESHPAGTYKVLQLLAIQLER